MMAQKETNTDTIVVGGGPVGSYAALNLARLGSKVTVFEEHPSIGFPSHCAGHLSIRSLRNMGLYPLPEGISENTFCAANFYSGAGTRFSIRLSCPATVVVSRSKFDLHLAKTAQEAGAIFNLNTRVQSLLVDDAFVIGANIKPVNSSEKKIYSKITLDAEGISSRLLKQAGLKPFASSGLVYGVEAEIENVKDIEQDAVEVYLGNSYAPGFYGWLIPRRDGTAKIGLATNHGDPREYLKRLMRRHPVASKQFAKAKITQIGYHAISLGGPIRRAYTGGFLAIGDCASQVKPTTGGGVVFGLKCAEIAAKVANLALKKNDVSPNFLKVYQKYCNDLLSFDFQVMLRLRCFLNSLSDQKIDEMIRVCGKLGVDKALNDVNEIDFQGKLLLTTFLKKPSMVAALAYFGTLYLSANP